MGVEEITTSNNTYTDEEIRWLRGEEDISTSAAINQIGSHAGLTHTYRVRGDDKTEREIKLEHQKQIQKEWGETLLGEGGTEGADHIMHHAGLETGLLMLPLTLGKLGYEMTKAVAEDNKVGHERAAALTKDAMHIVIFQNLNGLPQGFADEQLARYPESQKSSNLVKNMNRALGRDGDHRAMALIQLHCDQGMNAARAMCDANVDPKTYLAQHPDIAKRCAEDPAFKAGFDGLAWAKRKGATEYNAAVKELEARDARYEQAHVAWRAC
jgi:hypothetical protein